MPPDAMIAMFGLMCVSLWEYQCAVLDLRRALLLLGVEVLQYQLGACKRRGMYRHFKCECRYPTSADADALNATNLARTLATDDFFLKMSETLKQQADLPEKVHMPDRRYSFA